MPQGTLSMRTRLMVAGVATTLVVGAALFTLAASSRDTRPLPSLSTAVMK